MAKLSELEGTRRRDVVVAHYTAGGGVEVTEATAAPRVLVVEDDPQLLELYVDVLGDAGYEVLAARDGVDAVTHIASSPAVIVLDLEMPRSNGYEFLERLRATPNGRTIPVIVTSGGATGEWALRLGANEFVAKPAKVKDLVARVRRYAPI